MMYVDVFVDSEGEPIKHRIPVFKGDQANILAENFCIKHGYDLDTQHNLEQSLRQKIGEVVSKITSNPSMSPTAVRELQTMLDNNITEDQLNRTNNRTNSNYMDNQLNQIPETNSQEFEQENKSEDEYLYDN